MKCQGCDDYQPSVKRYRVTYHDGQSETVEYCDGCAELARMDWNGETAAIEGPLPDDEPAHVA